MIAYLLSALLSVSFSRFLNEQPVDPDRETFAPGGDHRQGQQEGQHHAQPRGGARQVEHRNRDEDQHYAQPVAGARQVEQQEVERLGGKDL